MRIPIEVSARHCHLSRRDIDEIFGRGYQPTFRNSLSQPGQYACKESIVLYCNEMRLPIRVIGPERDRTQIELAESDCHTFGFKPPRRASGNLDGALDAYIDIRGTRKTDGFDRYFKIDECIIIPERHLHLSPQHAEDLFSETAIVRFQTPKGTYSIHDVPWRLGEDQADALHIDVDDAIAFGIERNMTVYAQLQ